jgi:hypothetical protein
MVLSNGPDHTVAEPASEKGKKEALMKKPQVMTGSARGTKHPSRIGKHDLDPRRANSYPFTESGYSNSGHLSSAL